MIDRIMMSNSPSLRFVMLFVALPILWLAWLGWVIGAGVVGVLRGSPEV